MELVELIVSDSSGNTTEKKGTIIKKDNYSFYAVINEKDTNNVKTVIMSMPLGGDNNGLFRYPRVGEKILVGVQDQRNYLMAYLPNDDVPFETKEPIMNKPISPENLTDVFVDKDAQVFRYQKKGKALTGKYENYKYEKTDPTTEEIKLIFKGRDPSCSEIGFYHAPARWPSKNVEDNYCLKHVEWQGPDAKDPTKNVYEDTYIDRGVKLDSSKTIPSDASKKIETKYPYIDTINIQSTGDIITKAQSANEIHAQRLLLESTFLGEANISYGNPSKSKNEEMAKADKKDIDDITESQKSLIVAKLQGKDTSKYENNILKSNTNILRRHQKYLNITSKGADELKKGDICINAEGDITINAQRSIILKVGGSKIEITESGITISSSKGTGLIPGPFDATMSIERSGNISMGGASYSGSFETKAELTDTFGGGVSTSFGSTSVSGYEVGLDTYTNTSHIFNTANWLWSKINECISLCANYNKGNLKEEGKAYEVLAKIQAYAGGLAGVTLGQLKRSHGNIIDGKDGETVTFKSANLVPLILSPILSILDAVQKVVTEKYMAEKGVHLADGKYYSKLDQDAGLESNSSMFDVDISFLCVKMGVVATMKVAMLAMLLPKCAFHASSFKLNCDATIGMETKTFYQNTLASQDTNGPLAASRVDAPVKGDGETEEKFEERKKEHEKNWKNYKLKNNAKFMVYTNAGDNGSNVPLNKKLAFQTGIIASISTAIMAGVNEGYAIHQIQPEKEALDALADL